MPWECPSCGFANNDDAAENCMCGYNNPTHPTPPIRTAVGDSVVIMSPKLTIYWAAQVIIVILTAFAIFAVVIPVLSTGDFSSIWPTSDKRVGVKAGMFFGSILLLAGLPATVRAFSSGGEFYFYKDKLEIRTFLFNRTKIFKYENITVNQHGSYRVTIHQRNLPGWKSPLKQLKAIYLDGAGFGLSPAGYKDPSKLPLALEILKRSTDFREKMPS